MNTKIFLLLFILIGIALLGVGIYFISSKDTASLTETSVSQANTSNSVTIPYTNYTNNQWGGS